MPAENAAARDSLRGAELKVDWLNPDCWKGNPMQETVEQYKQRLMGYLGKQDPMRVQATTVAKIEKLVKGVPAAKLRKPPAPGKWSVAEILAHLADNTMVHVYRVKCILAAPGTPMVAYDQDRWAEVAELCEARSEAVVASAESSQGRSSGAPEIAPAGAVETVRRSRRARGRKYRENRADDGGARHQPLAADRSDPGPEEEIGNQETRKPCRVSKAWT